jgi:hypothetical protein
MRAIPIDIKEDLQVTIFDDVLDWEWFFDIRYNNLRLRANSGSGMIVTLISDTFKSYEWDPLYSMDDKVFGYWNNSQPMNAEDIGSELSPFFNGSDSKILKEIRAIQNGSKTATSSSGWKLQDFKNSLKSFFNLTSSPIESSKQDLHVYESSAEITKEDLLYFQTGDFDLDDSLVDDLDGGEDDYEFDANIDIDSYIDEHLELLLTEREVSNPSSRDTMPPTNRCLTSLEGLSKALTGKSLRELYATCILDEDIRFSGIMGKIMTLLTESPRMVRNLTESDRTIYRQEEDAISATLSLRTAEDLDNLNEGDLRRNIEDLDKTLVNLKNPVSRDILLQSRTRYVNMLSLLDIKE